MTIDLDKIALEIAKEMPDGFLWFDGCGWEAGILEEEAKEFARRLVERIQREQKAVAFKSLEKNYMGELVVRLSFDPVVSAVEIVPLFTFPPTTPSAVPDIDDLAQFIRTIDGAHSLGSGALAEKICEWLGTK